jgi:hypothetical protein
MAEEKFKLGFELVAGGNLTAEMKRLKDAFRDMIGPDIAAKFNQLFDVIEKRAKSFTSSLSPLASQNLFGVITERGATLTAQESTGVKVTAKIPIEQEKKDEDRAFASLARHHEKETAATLKQRDNLARIERERNEQSIRNKEELEARIRSVQERFHGRAIVDEETRRKRLSAMSDVALNLYDREIKKRQELEARGLTWVDSKHNRAYADELSRQAKLKQAKEQEVKYRQELEAKTSTFTSRTNMRGIAENIERNRKLEREKKKAYLESVRLQEEGQAKDVTLGGRQQLKAIAETLDLQARQRREKAGLLKDLQREGVLTDEVRQKIQAKNLEEAKVYAKDLLSGKRAEIREQQRYIDFLKVRGVVTEEQIQKINKMSAAEAKAARQELILKDRLMREDYRRTFALDSIAQTLIRLGTTAIATFSIMMRESTRFALSLTRLTQGYSLTIKEAVTLSGLAEATGVDIDTLTKGVGNYFQKIVTAGQGTSLVAGRVREALAFAGISAVRLGEQGMGAVDMLSKMREVYRTLKEPQDKAYLGQVVFGSEYEKFIPILSMTDETFQRLSTTFGAFAEIIGKDAAQKVIEFNAQFVALRETFRGFGMVLMGDISGSMAFIMERLKDFVALIKMIPTPVRQVGSVTTALVPILAVFAGTIVMVISKLQKWGDVMGHTPKFVIGLQTALKSLFGVWGGLLLLLASTVAMIASFVRWEQQAKEVTEDYTLAVDANSKAAEANAAKMLKSGNLTEKQSETVEHHTQIIREQRAEYEKLAAWISRPGLHNPFVEGRNLAKMETAKNLIDDSTKAINALYLSVGKFASLSAWKDVVVNLNEWGDITSDETMTMTQRINALSSAWDAYRIKNADNLGIIERDQQAWAKETADFIEQTHRNIASLAKEAKKPIEEPDTSKYGSRIRKINTDTMDAVTKLQDNLKAQEIAYGKFKLERTEKVAKTEEQIKMNQRDIDWFDQLSVRAGEEKNRDKYRADAKVLRDENVTLEETKRKAMKESLDFEDNLIRDRKTKKEAEALWMVRQAKLVAQVQEEIAKENREVQRDIQQDMANQAVAFWSSYAKIQLKYSGDTSYFDKAMEEQEKAITLKRDMAIDKEKESIGELALATKEGKALLLSKTKQVTLSSQRELADMYESFYGGIANDTTLYYRERYNAIIDGEVKINDAMKKFEGDNDALRLSLIRLQAQKKELDREWVNATPLERYLKDWDVFVNKGAGYVERMKRDVFGKLQAAFEDMVSTLSTKPSQLFSNLNDILEKLIDTIISSESIMKLHERIKPGQSIIDQMNTIGSIAKEMFGKKLQMMNLVPSMAGALAGGFTGDFGKIGMANPYQFMQNAPEPVGSLFPKEAPVKQLTFEQTNNFNGVVDIEVARRQMEENTRNAQKFLDWRKE